MTLTTTALLRWEPAALGGPAAQLRVSADTLEAAAAAVRTAVRSVTWQGRAADAFRQSSDDLVRTLEAAAATLRLQAEVLLRARAALLAAQDLLRRAQVVAAEHGLQVLPGGGVTAPPPVLTSGDPTPDAMRAVAAQQQAAHEARRRAEALARERWPLPPTATPTRPGHCGPDDGLGRLLTGLLPGAAGMLSCVLPGAALLELLAPERTALQNRLRLLAPDDPAVDQALGALAALDALEQVLRLPGRQLLSLDVSGELTTAAVAQGDVATAAHIAVLTPGFSTTVQGALAGHDRRMDALRRQAHSMSLRGGTGSVATISWLGYEAPQAADVLRPTRTVARAEAARRGAERLSAFYTGLDAARGTPVHLTALGHSYGSLTTGLALRPGTPVDDVVFFGSPGIGTSDVRDLGLQPGRVHVVEARRDAVADLAVFGDDPNRLAGVTGLSARAAVVNGRPLQESVGHSSYLLDDTTSQYGIAAVVAGRPELAPRNRGTGLGDWLQTAPTRLLRP